MNKLFKKVVVLLGFFFLWQLSYVLFDLNEALLPSPGAIALAFIENLKDSDFYIHILTSLKRVFVGFGLAAVSGVAFAFILACSALDEYVTPLLEILRPIPPIAWIPIAILIFGLGDGASYFIVFLGGFFPVFTNSLYGIKSFPKLLRNVSATFELRGWKYFSRILLPYSLPLIFNGLKIGLGMCWMSLIASELIGAQSGLGYFIQYNRLLLRTDYILVGMMTIGFIGFGLTALLNLLATKATPWVE